MLKLKSGRIWFQSGQSEAIMFHPRNKNMLFPNKPDSKNALAVYAPHCLFPVVRRTDSIEERLCFAAFLLG